MGLCNHLFKSIKHLDKICLTQHYWGGVCCEPCDCYEMEIRPASVFQFRFLARISISTLKGVKRGNRIGDRIMARGRSWMTELDEWDDNFRVLRLLKLLDLIMLVRNHCTFWRKLELSMRMQNVCGFTKWTLCRNMQRMWCAQKHGVNHPHTCLCYNISQSSSSTLTRWIPWHIIFAKTTWQDENYSKRNDPMQIGTWKKSSSPLCWIAKWTLAKITPVTHSLQRDVQT